MTNDEAVQWCADKNVKITFAPNSSTPRVVAQVQIPPPGSVPMLAQSLKVRETFTAAIEAIKDDYDAVTSGAKSPGDPSLVDSKLS